MAGTNLTVTLRPPTSGGKREYADEHELPVSKQSDAGEKITFTATNHSFVVVIPEADKIFSDPPEGILEPTLHFRVKAGTSEPTTKIKVDAVVGNYEYHVFCEEEGDWAHKRGSSPPKIVVDD